MNNHRKSIILIINVLCFLYLADLKSQEIELLFLRADSIHYLSLSDSKVDYKSQLKDAATLKKNITKFTNSFELLFGGGISFPFYDPVKEVNRERGLNPIAPLPKNWFWDYWDMGYIFEVGVGYSYAPKMIVNLLFNHSSYNLDKSEYLNRFEGYGVDSIIPGKTSILTITGNLKGDVSDFFYFKFGMGFYMLSVPNIINISTAITPNPPFTSYTVEQIDSGFNETGFVLELGMGVQFPIWKIKPYIEIDYAYFFLKEENASYFPLKAGLMYLF